MPLTPIDNERSTVVCRSANYTPLRLVSVAL